MTSYPTKTESASLERSASRRPRRALAGGLVLAAALSLAAPGLAGTSGPSPDDPFPRPAPSITPGLPNFGDTITVTRPVLGNAERTLGRVSRIGGRLSRGTSACNQSAGDVNRYLSCISDALDDFAAELDRIAFQLPPGMRNVATIVNSASNDIARIRNEANRRLAAATSDAEREQIRRDTLTAAAATMAEAASDIRKSISLIRASDPELANVQRETVFTVAQAVDNVGIQLTRAIGL